MADAAAQPGFRAPGKTTEKKEQETKKNQKSFRDLACDQPTDPEDRFVAIWEDKIGIMQECLEDAGFGALFDKHRSCCMNEAASLRHAECTPNLDFVAEHEVYKPGCARKSHAA